jgi:hypothetical protein
MYFLLVLAEAASPGALATVSQLISTLIWPAILIVFVLSQWRNINRVFSALALLAESANKIKLWQLK